MYKVDIRNYLEVIKQYYEEEEQREIEKMFFNITFKLEKNLYHLNNINQFVKNSSEKSGFFELLPIYFEAESLFVSLRSTVDMNLHLMNFCLELNIPSKEVYMNNVFHSPDLPSPFRNIFKRYTNKHSNPIWEFIYTFRNDIVHEKSILQKIQLKIQEIEGTKYIFAEINNQERELQDLFKECIKFLDRFVEQILSLLEIYLKQQKRKP